jgi:hypothetical protein
MMREDVKSILATEIAGCRYRVRNDNILSVAKQGELTTTRADTSEWEACSCSHHEHQV